MFIEELDEESKPCPVCGEEDNEDQLLLCDGCDSAYHIYCLGLDGVPHCAWFCDVCSTQRAIDSVAPNRSNQRAHNPPQRRTRGQQRRLRNRNQATDANWARVWQSVWDRLNLDLDFPYDEGPAVSQYRRSRHSASHYRPQREWERRLQVANQQGGINRFQETAPALLDHLPSRPRPELPEPESREEILAWNALEKAKDIQADPNLKKNRRKSTTTSPSDADPVARKRKRRSPTTSPAEPTPAPEPERRLKRPQTRRAHDLPDPATDSAGESSSSAARRRSIPALAGGRARPSSDAGSISGGPSFLQSLLKEVESSAAPDESRQARSPLTISALPVSDYSSPQNSSPGASPTNSNHPSPRALSTTPPPYHAARPGSPIPLTSKVEPLYPPIEFSPERSPLYQNSLATRRNHSPDSAQTNGRQSRALLHGINGTSPPRSEEASPSRINMSLSAKSEVQKMVKEALKVPYQNKLVSKDEYTDINRSISRMLYDKIGDEEKLNSDSREIWQQFAKDEVDKALRALPNATSMTT